MADFVVPVDYPSIQAAVDAVDDPNSNTIYIEPGTYTEKISILSSAPNA